MLPHTDERGVHRFQDLLCNDMQVYPVAHPVLKTITLTRCVTVSVVTVVTVVYATMMVIQYHVVFECVELMSLTGDGYRNVYIFVHHACSCSGAHCESLCMI